MTDRIWRWRAGLVVAFLLIAISTLEPSVACAVTQRVDTEDTLQKSRQLVEQLGSGSFIKRKRAMDELVRMGLPALQALEEGEKHQNREIRYRCKRVLLSVREVDLQRRLILFLRDPNGDKYKLPGWTAYKGVAGDNAESKHLFVAMQKADAELMLALEGKGLGLAELIQEGLLPVTRRSPSGESALDIGHAAAILFAVGDARVPVTQKLASSVYRLAVDPAARKVLSTDEGSANTLRRLLSRWMKRQKDTDPYPSLLVSMQYEIEEALIFATRVLKGPNRGSSAQQMALLSIHRWGDASHIKLVSGYLNNQTALSVTPRNGGPRVKIQLRDVALATLITLEKEDHRQFGFPHFLRDSNGMFHLSSIHFESDEARRTAFQRWDAFRKKKDPEDDDKQSGKNGQ